MLPNLDSTPTVYVVDDDDGVRKGLRRYLEARGFPVSDYASGSAFLAEVQAPKIGCLVLDFYLPGLTGLEILEQVQSRGWTLPAIIMTGHAHSFLEEQVLRSGAWAFLKKPFEPHVLFSTIEQALCTHSTF